MRVCKTCITIVIRDHLRIPLYAKASCPPSVSVPLIAGLSEDPPEDRDLKEKKVQRCVGHVVVELHCGPCHGLASACAKGILSA